MDNTTFGTIYENGRDQQPESSSRLQLRTQAGTLNQRSIPAVFRIPREILETIFEDCLPHEGWCKPSAGEMPLVLGRVCSTWRQVVCTTPRLWRSLELDLSQDMWYEMDEDGSSVACDVMPIWILHVWLDRASEHPIRLRLLDEPDPMDADIILPIVELLCSHAHRWRGLHLTFYNMPRFSFFFDSVFRSNLVSLTDASIQVRTGDAVEQSDFDLQQLSSDNIPRLIRFSWDVPVAPAKSLSKTAWGRLTELSLFYDIGPHDSWRTLQHGFDQTIFKVLRHTRNLTTLNIGIADKHPYVDMPRIVLPHLCTLRLRRRSTAAKAGNAASRYSFPALRRLEIDNDPTLIGSGHVLSSEHNALKCLFSRPGCALEALSLCYTHFSEDGIVELLDCCPELKELTLLKATGGSENSAVLYFLLGRLKNRAWIPHLETLKIGTTLDFCTPLRSITDVATARSGVLREVVVTLSHPEGEGEDQHEDVFAFIDSLDRLSEREPLKSTVTVSVERRSPQDEYGTWF